MPKNTNKAKKTGKILKQNLKLVFLNLLPKSTLNNDV